MKILLLSLLIAALIITVGLYASSTDNRVRTNNPSANYIVVYDKNGVPITPSMTYINDYFHYEIGTFNHMEMDTLTNVTATVDTILLPDSLARGFVIRNFNTSDALEFWLDTDVGDHRWIQASTSYYIPTIGLTLFVKTSTVPELLLEFGK